MSSNQAAIVAAIGASGSGKSLWIKTQLRRNRKLRRLIIWDPQSEYAEFGMVCASRTALADVLIAAGARGEARVVYQPKGGLSAYVPQFDWLCQTAYAWGNCTLVADELGDVTKPGWAPDGWSMVIRKGRHAGLTVIGAAQRPAIIDKTFFGLATLVHCGRLNYAADLKVMSDVLDVSSSSIVELLPLEYIERDMQTGKTRPGRVDVPT